MPTLPLPGPLDREPTHEVYAMAPGRPVEAARAMLQTSLDGITLGAYDQRIVTWLQDWDIPTVATIASMNRRLREAGRAEGRTEQVDESPTVQHLAAALGQTTRALDAAGSRLDLVYGLLDQLEDTAASAADTAALAAAITSVCRRARRP